MNAEPRKGDWIQTYTLRQFWPLDPRPEDVDLRDVAHALSMICRFTGHVNDFYSVAQHSVLVSLRAESLARVRGRDDALLHARCGLLHDASEAYLVDVARPVKRLPEMAAYREAEKNVQRTIMRHFGLPDAEPELVKRADVELLYTEARDLFSGVNPEWQWFAEPLPMVINPVAPREAERLFLERFRELFGEAAR
jgi:5'-deoxynucleotidase YfbR-like HD superfamily hydrolase